MVSKTSLLVGFFYFLSYVFLATEISLHTLNNLSFVSPSVGSGCSCDEAKHESSKETPKVVLNLKHRLTGKASTPADFVMESRIQDWIRIQTLHARIAETKKQNPISRIMKNDRLKGQREEVSSPAPSPESYSRKLLTASLRSGGGVDSGEYLIDVFVGTPPRHFPLILDTGSDLNWIQCDPCLDCFKQKEPYYNPKKSSSFRHVRCNDPRCRHAIHPTPSHKCEDEEQTCPYFYWYGDSSNTTGDLALETFAVDLTTWGGRSESIQVENVMFGCGHWNRGQFPGAAGVLGLGRGPLSFASQLQSLYGHSFSYCLVDRDSRSSSRLVFGEDKELLNHPGLNFTAMVPREGVPMSTFYYVDLKSVVVGGEEVNIPRKPWGRSWNGVAGTIIDSGATMSYFTEPAYEIIKEAFVKKVKKGYRIVKDYPDMGLCYNVYGARKLEMPSLRFVFADGAVWDFPVENYFINLERGKIACLAIVPTPHSALSIIGNYQQQNFHVLYDEERSRLGFAPAKCGDA